MKNIKSMFFVLTLITLLITVGAACAADDANTTTAVDNSISDAAVSDNDYIAAEPVQTTSNNKVDTKTIEKEEKNLKRATKIVEVNNYNELTAAINSAASDSENDTYIINLNDGTYQITSNTQYTTSTYPSNITINANNQKLTANTASKYIVYNNKCNITINDAIYSNYVRQSKINLTLNNCLITDKLTNEATLTLKNTTINPTSSITNKGKLIIYDDCFINEGLKFSSTGTIISNNSNIVYPYLNTFDGENKLNNMTIEKSITNKGILTLNNVTINNTITNNGKLFISDDCTFGENCVLTGTGELIINDANKIIDIFQTFNGNYTFTNISISNAKINIGNVTLINCIINETFTNKADANLTLINCTINSQIKNKGNVYIDDNIIFNENGKITEAGPIITNDIVKILPNLSTVNGNYTISNVVLNKNYKFKGNNTLNNCTILSSDNSNFGILTINNSIINSKDTIAINNYGLILISNNTQIINGNITGVIEVFNETIADDFNYNTNYHVVTNDTATQFFDLENIGELTEIVKEGDVLDFQGTISGIPGLTSLVINKPVNIITSTNDGRIENFSSITYNNGASGSNITGLYTYNTQFYVRNAHNIVFDEISNVVNSARIGWGVGQTSIGHNSTNITVKNSYFYTKDNGGSSTFVFNWADNSTLINSTVEADGNVGNLIYLTTYNVDIPSGTTANCNNHIINNTIRGPETAAAICWAIALSGANNIVDGNTIHYVGTGITGQWGSGITGEGIEDNGTSLVGIYNNKVYNNQIYCGNAFTGMNNTTLINNTIYEGLFAIGENNIVYNNTANNVRIMASNAIIEGNNFTGMLNIIGSKNNITHNNIITNDTYTMTGTGTNNIITDNYLKSLDKYADESVNLNKETNTIANNTPKIELIIDTTTFTPGQSTTIQAGIYFDGEIVTTITKGKVTFKVNGKTLKDANGKVIYVKVTEGIATIENYIVPDTWKEGSIIEAVYSGSTQCDKLTSEKTEITLNKEAPTFTIDSVEPTTAGSTITLKATITDNNKEINTGKVVFKINGKTLKDANGKVIYAKIVNNTVIVEYTLPDSYKAKDYNITAVLISPDYERLEDSKTLTVN